MELTPHGLRDIEFSERWRGYDPQEVDEFCDRVAQLIEVLQQRRDHDEAVRDHEDLRASITALQRTRADLEAEVAALSRYVDEERMRVRAVLAEVDRRLEDTVMGIAARRRRLAPVGGVPELPFDQGVDEPQQGDTGPAAPAGDNGTGTSAASGDQSPVHDADGDDGSPTAAAGSHTDPERASMSVPRGTRRSRRKLAAAEAGPDAAPVPPVDTSQPTEEQFFAELWGALDDDEPLGPSADNAPGAEAARRAAQGSSGGDSDDRSHDDSDGDRRHDPADDSLPSPVSGRRRDDGLHRRRRMRILRRSDDGRDQPARPS